MNNSAAISFAAVGYEVNTLQGQSFSILKELDFTAEVGEFICIVGPSGCGKTTALNILAGFIKPTGGSIAFGDTASIQPAMCFQSDTTFGWMTCKNNFQFALNHNPKMRNKDSSALMEEFFSITGLTAFKDFYPTELSGGMRKRLELGRAWLAGSPIVALDEPLGQLDHMTRQSMQLSLQDLWLRDRRTVLMITHDNEEALFLADRVFVMSGPPGQLAHIIPVPFARPRKDDLRFSQEFQALRHDLQQVLGSSESAKA